MTIDAEAPGRAGSRAAPAAPEALVTGDTGDTAAAPTRSSDGWLAAIVAVATASLVVGLGRRPFWQDEALSLGATTELATTWKQTGGTMGAYYALLTPWSQVSHDRAWIRLLSVLAALAVLPVLYRLARAIGDATFARMATAVLAGSWLFARYAQEARSYALALLLTTVGWLALVEWVRAPERSDAARRWHLVYAVVAVLAILSHGLTGLQVLAQLAALALLPDRTRRFRAMVPAIAATFLTLAVLTTMGAAEVANWVPPLSLGQLHGLLAELTGPSPVAQVLVSALVVAGAALAVGAFRRAPRTTEGWLHAVVLLWALGPPIALVALSVLRPYLVPRYVLGSVPGLALLVALALDRLRSRRPLLLATVALLALVLLAGRVSLYEQRGADWAGAARVVAEDAAPGDLVAFPTLAVRQPFDVAWHELSTPGRDPEVVSPVGPLGEVRRFYRFHATDEVPGILQRRAPARIWVVAAVTVGQGDTLGAFLAAPELAGYRVAARHAFAGDLTVVLLQRR